MDYKNIDHLLEKYWAGESNLEEELILKDYFQQEDIAPQYEQFRPLFQYFSAKEETKLSADFDQKLLQQLKSVEREEVPVVSLNKNRVKSKTWMVRIAAAIALLFSLWFLFEKPSNPGLADLDPQEIEEAKIAYKQAKAALLLLSGKLNKGTETAVNGLDELDKATNVLGGN